MTRKAQQYFYKGLPSGAERDLQTILEFHGQQLCSRPIAIRCGLAVDIRETLELPPPQNRQQQHQQQNAQFASCRRPCLTTAEAP